ncbi:MAG TPA: HAMP domain-containing sensor histidine kinase, partial [Marinilabiliaceae bacterium]|nr:HAMP domain-containing sensor histidine kinase [Marinilabiliaceae bacterium]
SGDSLLNLINDIIDISKMESGKFKLSPTHFDLHALLDRINLMVQTDIKKQKQNNIEFILKKGVQKKEYFIFTDRFRLEQVLNNLITNALKFTKNGMIELSYKILDEENIAFTVADTGIGIAPEDQMVIFDRFRQIDNNNYESKGGIGLGLSITKNIIQLMNGEIKVDSEISKGSKFSFTIPCILKE